MSQIAKLTVHAENSIPMSFVVPAILGVNSMLLYALDMQAAIPRWVKLAATIFLSF